MTSRKAPSQRNPEYAFQRISRALQSMSPGTMNGRVANAAPLDSSASQLLPYLGAIGVNGLVDGIARVAVTYTTGNLAVNEIEKGIVQMAITYQVIYIQTDHPARVRLYTDPTHRDRDGDRPITYDPYPGVGIYLDYLTAPELLEAPIVPPAIGAIFDDTQGTDVPISITSIYGGPVVVTLTYLALE